MEITPINSHVLVERIEEDKTAGGIIIPDTAKKISYKGIVVQVGDGQLLTDGRRIPCRVKVGDKIVFLKNYWQDVKVDGKNLILIKEGDIFGILED